MTPKYSTGLGDGDDTQQWREDRRHVLHEWSVNPFVGVRHRHETVYLRVVVEYSHEVGADIILEARSDDSAKFADEWAPVETIEVREYGARHDRRPEPRWLT